MFSSLEAPLNFKDIVYKAVADADSSGLSAKKSDAQSRPGWRKKMPLAFVCCALVMVCFLVLALLPEKSTLLPDGIALEIKAAMAYSGGIDPEKGFVITSNEPLTKAVLVENLKITPGIEYSIEEKVKGTEFLIVPEEPMADNTVYKITLETENKEQPLSWAFQTISDFKLVEAIPGDTSAYVPVNIGITLSFSQELEADFSNKLSIEPAVSGQWELQKNKKTIVFMADAPLEYATVYTITISQQLSNLDGNDFFEEDTAIRFETEMEDMGLKQGFLVGGNNNAFRPSELPYFTFYNYSSDYASVIVKTEVFKYPDQNAYSLDLEKRLGDYLWCAAAENAYIETDGLSKVLGTELTFDNSDGYYANNVFLPEPLPQGYYVARFSNESTDWQILFQVTELSAHLSYSSTNDEALLWLNSLETGQMVSGAKIEIPDAATFTSDKNGIAIIDLSQKSNPEKGTLFLIEQGKQTLVLSAKGYYNYNNKRQDAYWRYIYVDRELYRPGDTVNFFGVLDSRNPEYADVETAKVVLNGYQIANSDNLSQTIAIKNGVFDGQYVLPWLEPGYYYLTLYLDDVYMTQAYFEVALYSKPTYKITLEPAAEYLMAGAAAEWNVSTSYYDGSPLPNTLISVYDREQGNKQVTTGSQGEAVIKTTPVSNPYGLVSRVYLTAYAMLPETGTVEASAYLSLFNTDLDIQVENSRQGNQAKLSLQPYEVDLNKITDPQREEDLEEQSRSPFTGTASVELVVERLYWEKQQIGTYYDPYTKELAPRYDYEYRREVEDTLTVELSGSEAKEVTLSLKTEDGYTVYLNTKDKAGRELIRETHVPSIRQGAMDNYYNRYLNIVSEKWQFEPGEEVVSTVYWGSNQVHVGDGRILFYQSQQNILGYEISASSVYKYTFSDEYLPNLNLSAVYFDGRSYYSAYTSHRVLTSAKTAQVEITTPKETYAPGEKVTISVSLKDKDGNPLQGYLNLNLVDEALLALRDQEVNILDRLLNNTYYHNYMFSSSHLEAKDSAAGAESGGEGDGTREDFRDTALFVTLETDSAGRGSVEFTLPDNVTTWRVIWQAYASDFWAASGTDSIVATLPYFLTWRLENFYLKGDSPSLALRSGGLALTEDAQVDYQVVLDDSAPLTSRGGAFAWTEFELPTLRTGVHKLALKGSYNQAEDNVNLEFEVIDSRISHQSRTSQLLGEGKLQGAEQGLTNLFFSDEQKNQALGGLFDLAYQRNVRFEQTLSSYLAKKILAEEYKIGEMPTPEEERLWKESLLKYQGENGGFKILTYADSPDSSLRASALAASFAKGYLPESSLLKYFNRYLENEEATLEQKSLALWGLAALSQPVLIDIEELYNDPQTPASARLNLIMAIYFSGNSAEAKNIVQDFVNTWTEPIGQMYRAKAEASSDNGKILDATASLALLANVYNLPQADGLYQYILENRNEEDYYLLEKLGIIQSLLKRKIADASFSYSLNGDSHEVDLGEFNYYSLTLTPQELANISFTKLKGEVTVTSTYQAPGLPSSGPAGQELSLTRNYPANSELNSSLKDNGWVKISLDYQISENAPAGYYEIREFLPVGLTFVKASDEMANYRVWLTGSQDKEITFGLYKNTEAVSGTVTYYARASATGTFNGETAYIMHTEHNDAYATAPAVSVTIE